MGFLPIVKLQLTLRLILAVTIDVLQEEVNDMKAKLSNVEAKYLETKVVNETLLSYVENLNERLELLIPSRTEEIINYI